MAIDLNGLNDQDTQQGLDGIFQNPVPVQQPVYGNATQPNDSWNNQLSDDFSVPDVQEDYQTETQHNSKQLITTRFVMNTGSLWLIKNEMKG